MQSAEKSATILELVLDGFLNPKESRKCALPGLSSRTHVEL